jgi:predicted 2-oxoglutarate/Fe(II)-dependent dioxygenase YbiX/peroxiredoxin
MSDPRPPGWGEPAPWFHAAALSGSPTYAFSSVAGRHVLLLFFGSGSIEPCARALDVVRKHRDVFDDERACFFGVTTDPQDVATGRIAQALPGIRYFLDYDGKVSRLYGAQLGTNYRPHWLLLDPRLRVIGRFAIDGGEEAIKMLQACVAEPVPSQAVAPILVVPHIFEPELCRELIRLYQENGGQPSGFMREIDGKTTLVTDPAHKQRRDYDIYDPALRQALASRVKARLIPAVKHAFQFQATRIERYLVACYEAGAGHFRPHRDNTTKGTAHRRFAVTINLNAGEYEGGDLRFPEFGSQTYRAPTGGAVVFSCSLLHEATEVTAGKRYAFLPFLYDDEAARIREENSEFMEDGARDIGTTWAPRITRRRSRFA